MKHIVLIGLLTLVFAVTPLHTTHAETNAELITKLLAQIVILQAELNKLLAAQGGAPPCTFTRLLIKGTQGTDVTCLQNYLKSKGHFQGTPTGYFGPQTEAAVSSWQHAHGIVAEPWEYGHFGEQSRVIYAKDLATTASVPTTLLAPVPVPGSPVPVIKTYSPKGSTPYIDPILLTVTTDIPTTCRYGTTPEAYASLTQVLNGDNTTEHTAYISLVPGMTDYAYYVRCMTIQGGESGKKRVEFRVVASSTIPAEVSNLAGVWYVAPTGSGAGLTNGTSLANACDGPSDPSCRTVAPGDTVHLVGAFDADDIFSVPSVGTSKSPIVYQCAPGTTLKGERNYNTPNGFNTASGAYETSGHTWTLVSGEVYKQTFGAIQGANWMRSDGILMTPEQHSADSEATIVAALARGEWTTKVASPKVIYVRMPDGASPDRHVLTINAHDIPTATLGFITINEKNYNTIKDCVFIGGAHETKWSGVHSVNSVGTLLTNVQSSYSLWGASVDGGSMTVRGGKFSFNYGTGLAVWGATAPMTSLVVDGAEFNDQCFTGWFTGPHLSYSLDCDGIGIGHDGGTIGNVVIKNSKFYRNGPRVTAVPTGYTGGLAVGSGISLSTSFRMDTASLTVTGNEFRDNFRLAMQVGTGGAGNTTDVIFAGNLVRGTISGDFIDPLCTNTPVGTIKIGDNTAGNGKRWIANNTFDHNNTCATMFLRNLTTGVDWRVQNNILSSNNSDSFTTDDRADIWIENATSNYAIGSNTFFNSQHSDGDAARDYYRIVDTESIVAQGVNDQIVDSVPFINGNPSASTDFRLAPGSPLINAGIRLGNYEDNLGHKFNNPPSIGAFEIDGFVSLSPTRVPLTSSQTKSDILNDLLLQLRALQAEVKKFQY